MLLKIENLRKFFGGVHALDGVDLALDNGRVLGIAGDNGAGKSTLMKCITGLLSSDGGDIYLNNARVTGQSAHDRRAAGIEMVYQDLALCPQLGGTANIFLGREIRYGVGPFRTPVLDHKSMERKARSIFDTLSVDLDLSRPAGSLSGGQRQGLAIARALLTDPRLLILDEPTAALGVKETETVLRLIEALKAKGIAIILISHRLSDFFRLADHIAVMRHGKIVEYGDTSKFSLDGLTKSMLAA